MTDIMAICDEKKVAFKATKVNVFNGKVVFSEEIFIQCDWQNCPLHEDCKGRQGKVIRL